MGKLIFIILGFCVCYPAFCKVVDNDSIFLSENKLWSVLLDFSYIHVHPNDPYPYLESNWYKFDGDTVINEVSYKKVLASSDSLQNNWVLRGGFREEGGKVYYLKDFDNEALLYDFTMEKNDTMVHFLDPFYYVTRVDSIRDYQIGTAIKKKYYLTFYRKGYPEETRQEIWIEGIGSLFGLLRNQCQLLTSCFHNYRLLCFHESDELIYKNPEYSTCYVDRTIVSFKLIGLEDRVFLHPNPAKEKVRVKIRNNSSNQFELDIFNLNGTLMDKRFINSGQEEINLIGYEPGLYIIRIKSGFGIINKKLIVR